MHQLNSIHQIRMHHVYLGEGLNINLLHWELLQTHKPQIFLGERNLSNRALDLTRRVKNIPNRSPVKLIESDIIRLLMSIYNDFLKRNNDLDDQRVSYLLKVSY
ncbi:hypothetical protein TSAR_015326, partial [Trichomalopsis sarcophagae]